MIHFTHRLILLTRSVTLIKEIVINQFVNILLTNNSQISVPLDRFRNERSLFGAKEEIGYYVTRLSKLHLCSLLKHFQRLCQSSQPSILAGAFDFPQQWVPTNYL